MESSHRESEASWLELLQDLKHRNLGAPKLALGDGALGFWNALSKAFPVRYYNTKGAVKVHVGLDHEGMISLFMTITDYKNS